MFTKDDRVESEFGKGTVVEYSPRRLIYRLDSGETINVVTGTPGFGRVRKLDEPTAADYADAARHLARDHGLGGAGRPTGGES